MTTKEIIEKLHVEFEDFKICGAVYDISDGHVDWL